ncbi:MAG: hypothetical protein GOV15_02035, partial [Candidatus Diapherotrites archaeon]|nr:hypothetical protein [Candidatus Diapherotrites archaeon]
MKPKVVRSNGKILAYVYFLTDFPKSVSSRDGVVDFLAGKVSKTPMGYAGNSSKTRFKSQLKSSFEMGVFEEP